MDVLTEMRQFQFVRHEKVYDGQIDYMGSDELERVYHYRFSYNLRYEPWEHQRFRGIDVTIESTSEKGFSWTYFETYVVRAFDSIDGQTETFAFSSENIGKYLPRSSGLAIETAANLVAQLMYRFVVESDLMECGLADLRISSGLDKTLFDRTLRHLGRKRILGIAHMGTGRQTQELAPKDGFERLEEFVNAVPRSTLDFDSQGHRYFRNHDRLPDGVSRPFVFVIMPFRQEEFPQEFYSERLKLLVERQFGRSCFRVDEDPSTRGVMDKVATFVRDAELVVSEISTLNPNVMYELGIAHILDKESVVLWNPDRAVQKEPPFDVSRYSLTYYTDSDFESAVGGAIKAVLK